MNLFGVNGMIYINLWSFWIFKNLFGFFSVLWRFQSEFGHSLAGAITLKIQGEI